MALPQLNIPGLALEEAMSDGVEGAGGAGGGMRGDLSLVHKMNKKNLKGKNELIHTHRKSNMSVIKYYSS